MPIITQGGHSTRSAVGLYNPRVLLARAGAWLDRAAFKPATLPNDLITAIALVPPVAAGLIILFWPSISLVLLLTILGAWLLFYGVVLVGLAFQLRRQAAPPKASGRRSHEAAPA